MLFPARLLMHVEDTPLPGVKLLRPTRHGDARGWFSETWRRDALAAAGIDADFVQDNHSMSGATFTIRGLHFQVPPHAQGKLVRVARGAILDVVVDLREGSPTRGRHFAARLTPEDSVQIWVPPGFAHGFCTLAPDTEVVYKVTAYYSAAHDRALRFDDPALGIDWPVTRADAHLSAKDAAAPTLAELGNPFPEAS